NWFAIFEFNNDHNHSCAQDKHKYLIDRHIPVVYKLMADLNEDCGIPARASYDTIKKAVGGAENLGFTHTDLKNHIRTRRTRAIENGDVSVLLNHLSSESNSKPGYFYEMQVDCEDQIASIFWADGQMRMDYQYFGDCISFDTIYRTNRTCRPLAIFVGKNQHHHLVIFGAALLYDETSATFEWLFSTFKKCMNDNEPTTIFTDQRAAIKAGITSVFPNTFHGLCTFHILQYARPNLRTLCTPKFRSMLRYVMYNIETEEEFEEGWKEIITTCFANRGPRGHKWLEKLYNI
ncbi:Protein FAR1-RELATED SEQUENCE 5, partial [Linum perenne]